MAARSLEGMEQLLGWAEAVSTGLVEAVIEDGLDRQLVGSLLAEEGDERRGEGGERRRD